MRKLHAYLLWDTKESFRICFDYFAKPGKHGFHRTKIIELKHKKKFMKLIYEIFKLGKEVEQ